MNVKPNQAYNSSKIGQFFLIRIQRLDGQPIFWIRTPKCYMAQKYSLSEMRELGVSELQGEYKGDTYSDSVAMKKSQARFQKTMASFK